MTLEQLYALTNPEIQRIFLETMQGVVDDVILEQMVKAIEDNDPEALFRASGFTPAALAPLLDRIEQTYRDGGITESSTWPKVIVTPAGPVRFRFDLRNVVVEQDLKKSSSELVTRLTEEVRSNLRTMLQRGMIAGDNPRQTALNIVGKVNPVTKKREGGIIGMTVAQEGWVANAERYLTQGDEKYLTLKLRDKRFDGIVRKALKDGNKLTKTDIDKLVTSYKNKVLKFRADMIARTETIQSINRGAAASYEQAMDEGTLSRGQVTKEWDDVGDGRTRHTHKTMGSKYGKGKGVEFDDVFISPSGSRFMFPGDTSLGADASEIVLCRCKTRYRVNWRYNIKND